MPQEEMEDHATVPDKLTGPLLAKVGNPKYSFLYYPLRAINCSLFLDTARHRGERNEETFKMFLEK